MTPRITLLGWVERALLSAGLVFGGWSLLSAAQEHFYRSLPVPAVERAARLPGEEPSAASPPGGRTTIAQGEWVARVEAPAVGLTATVIEGSTDSMLARAAGHIEGTAFPGEAGNVGIAGHRDTTFRPVRRLRVGDRLRVVTAADTLDYRITRTLVVNPEDVYVLNPTEHPTLTLVTCYPFTFIGSAPQRYIVQAELVEGGKPAVQSGRGR
jgi:sortase A